MVYSFDRRTVLSILLISLAVAKTGQSENIEPIAIGQHRQMFIDDYLIERSENITRRLCPVNKHPENPIVQADRSWERGLAVPQGSVIYDADDKLYKMWYTTNVQSRGEGDSFNKGKGLAYAISTDGVHWEKPELDIVLEEGAKTNQVIAPMEFGFMYQPYFVIKDQHEQDPARRYKMAFLSIQRNVSEHETDSHPDTRRGTGIAFSPDGLHWKKARDFASDDLIDISHFMIDPQNDDEFVIYGRTLRTSPEIREAWQHYDWFEPAFNGRAVIRSTSRDFLNWSPAQFIMGPDLEDPPSTEIYSMNVFPYEGIYLGLVQCYLSRTDTSTIDIQLAISRDGIHFERPFREAFFPLGPVGTWDRFILHNMSGPPLPHEDELRFYYGGRTSRHRPNNMADAKPGGAIGLATVLKDRFVAVEASFDDGTLLTKPLQFAGEELFINCNTAFGEIGIRLLDRNGKPIDGYEATVDGVDSTAYTVEFDPPLSRLTGEPVRIEFSLANAQLYSFSVR